MGAITTQHSNYLNGAGAHFVPVVRGIRTRGRHAKCAWSARSDAEPPARTCPVHPGGADRRAAVGGPRIAASGYAADRVGRPGGRRGDGGQRHHRLLGRVHRFDRPQRRVRDRRLGGAGCVRLRAAEGDRGREPGQCDRRPDRPRRGVRIAVDRQRVVRAGRRPDHARHGAQPARRAGRSGAPELRPARAGHRARPAAPAGRRVGHRQHPRRRGLGPVRRAGRGDRRRQHRHRRAVRPPGPRQPVPGQSRRRRLRPQLQLVGPERRLRPRRATTTATAPTPWARWSATTAPATRSASPPAPDGSRPTAAPTRARTSTCCRPVSSMLAPTDLDGENPRPDLRPHVVNNSWGGNSAVERPVHRRRHRRLDRSRASSACSRTATSGPECDTHRVAGRQPRRIGVGAYDINNEIAGFSSRGPGENGELKPNIAAPGVDVRSSLPGSGYAIASAGHRWRHRTSRAPSP